jgi:hypothetical protein
MNDFQRYCFVYSSIKLVAFKTPATISPELLAKPKAARAFKSLAGLACPRAGGLVIPWVREESRKAAQVVSFSTPTAPPRKSWHFRAF